MRPGHGAWGRRCAHHADTRQTKTNAKRDFRSKRAYIVAQAASEKSPVLVHVAERQGYDLVFIFPHVFNIFGYFCGPFLPVGLYVPR